MISDEVRAVIQSLHSPALILSQSRKIVAANNGACRLSGRSSNKSLEGHEINEAGFVLTPADRPAKEDWDQLFARCTSDQEKPAARHRSEHDDGADRSRESLTRDFWNDENQSSSIVVDVEIAQGGNVSASHSAQGDCRIRARMSIQNFQIAGNTMYLIELQRPLSLPQTPPEGSSLQTMLTDLNESKAEPSKEQNFKDRETQVHEIVSTAIPYFTALFDADGQAVHFSLSWAQVTGLAGEEALGSGWFQVIHPDDKQAMIDAWTEVVRRRGDSWAWEARYRRGDGSYKWFLVRLESSEAQFDGNDYWYGSMMDVDLLVTSRQESENRRKSIMALISHTNVSLWGLKTDRTLMLQEGSSSWDPATALYPPAEEHGDRLSDVNKRGMTRIFDAVADILGGKSTARTLEHQYEDRWYRSTLIPDRQGQLPHQRSNQAIQAVLGLTIDITDVRARAELQIQNETLIEKERAAREASELKSRFVANISHELRTPIAGIIGMNDLLLESLSSKEDHERRNFADNIRSSAAQLLNVINDVLDLSKIEAGRLEIESVPFRIPEVISMVFKIMAVQAAQKELAFTCENANVPPAVVLLGDPNRLQQVLLNLLSNSIKFTMTGKITLNISIAPRPSSDEGTSHTRNEQPENHLSSLNEELIHIQIVVEDTGCGMTQATIDSMFEPFSQADSSTARQYGGTGLGLTITRQLVHMMGGLIQVTSTVSVGTRAVVVIPFLKADRSVGETGQSAYDTPDPPTNAANPVGEAKKMLGSVVEASHSQRPGDSNVQPSRSPTMVISDPTHRSAMLVLIVEDNPVNLKIATLMTKKLGFQTITASNGQEALAILEHRSKSEEPSPSAILMDCMMPIMDGYEATRGLRQDATRFSASLRKIPIIALTASAHKGDMERCLEAGMDDYLTKPVNKKKLEAALTRWTLREGK